MTAFSATVRADSTGPNGVRLTTLEVTFPRFILAEFNTHRAFSRNSGSSRAVPTRRLVRRIEQHPVGPLDFRRNKAGMQGGEPLGSLDALKARGAWRRAEDAATFQAQVMADIGVHKERVNRLLEPYSWHTVIVTSTEWSNFFAQRDHEAADPAMQRTARLMREAMDESTPATLQAGDMHLPYIEDRDRDALTPEDLCRVSVARCARVSYLTHDQRRDLAADLDLYRRLSDGMHMSPFEHVAEALPKVMDRADCAGYRADVLDVRPVMFSSVLWSGNFRGWRQVRKSIPGECR